MYIVIFFAIVSYLCLRTGLLSRSSRFSGLRSLCAMFRWWHFCIARAIWNEKATLNVLSLCYTPLPTTTYSTAHRPHAPVWCIEPPSFPWSPWTCWSCRTALRLACTPWRAATEPCARNNSSGKLLTQTFTWLALRNIITVQLQGYYSGFLSGIY